MRSLKRKRVADVEGVSNDKRSFQAAGDDCPFGHWEPTSSYLTDGKTLYRYVDGVPSGTGELVALEDCRSLKLVLFSLDELRALGLRDVDPAASESRNRSPD